MNIIEELVHIFIEPIRKTISDILQPIIGHPTAEERKDLEQTAKAFSAALSPATAHSKMGDPRLTTDAAETELDSWALKGQQDAETAWKTSVVTETLSLGQVDICLQGYMSLPVTRAYFDAVAAIWGGEMQWGKIPFYQRAMQKKWRPALPDVRDLSPMLWRHLITEADYSQVLAETGLPDYFIKAYVALTQQLPAPDDLIRFVVREVISPGEFITQMGKQGFGAGWAGAYWTAHFVLPSPGNLVDAYHRGIISQAELEKFVFWHDYMPEPRPGISKSDLEIMRGLTKTLIPRVDLRRAWSQGAVSDAELLRGYQMLGFEDDSELMASVQKTIALTAERSGLAKQYLAALRKGVKTEAEIRSKLTALKLPAQAIDYLIETETIRREIGSVDFGEEPRVLSSPQILSAFKKGLINDVATAELLRGQGWVPEAIDVLLALNAPEPVETSPITELRTAAAANYREGWLDPETFEGILRKANYREDQILSIREAEDLRYRLDFLNDLRSTAIEAYRKDLLTDVELEDHLITLGLQPERARAIVAKESYRKMPKPKA